MSAMTELKDQLSLLGRKTEYKQDYAPEVLEAFDNKHPEKLGTLSQKVDSDIKVEVGTHTDVHTQKEIPAVLVLRPTNQPRHRSLHGLYRALINNMVIGVSKGYEIKQELVGVGFKAEVKGNILEMPLPRARAHSHSKRNCAV